MMHGQTQIKLETVVQIAFKYVIKFVN